MTPSRPVRGLEAIWNAYDVLLRVAGNLSFLNLLRLRYGTHPGPKAVREVLRTRVDFSFSPFLSQQVVEFFYSLRSCRGIVMGGVVNEVLLSKNEHRSDDDGVNAELDEDGQPKVVTTIYRAHHVSLGDFRPSTMVVVVETNATELRSLLELLGYEQSEMDQEDYDDAIAFIRRPSDVLRLKMEAFERTVHDKVYTILLLTSRHSTLSVLLSANSTADMNCISFHSILSYYPRLIFRKEGLFTSEGVNPQTRPLLFTTDEGLNVFSDNRHWKKPCGVYCPAAWRQTFDDSGVMRVDWFPGTKPASMQIHGGVGEDGDDEAYGRLDYSDSLTWRVSNCCINPACGRGRRYQELSQFIDM